MTDVFTVVFFVSVGMLLDPAILLDEPWAILALLAVIVVGKSVAAVAIVALRRGPLKTGLTVGAGLAQIGEFSFIVATAALELGLMPSTAFQVIVAAALLSITLNPVHVHDDRPARTMGTGAPTPRSSAPCRERRAMMSHA